jgi:hypothetical protein
VEILTNGVFGSLCTNAWDGAVAAVICRELGYRGGLGQEGYGYYPFESFYIDGCAGTEDSLLQCKGATPLAPYSNCGGRSQGLGVICFLPGECGTCWHDIEALSTPPHCTVPRVVHHLAM